MYYAVIILAHDGQKITDAVTTPRFKTEEEVEQYLKEEGVQEEEVDGIYYDEYYEH